MQHLFTNDNPVHCKENAKHSVSSVSSIEDKLLIDKKCLSFFLRLGPTVKI